MKLFRKISGILNCQLNLLTNHTCGLPFVLLNITTRCNSRCVICGYGKELKEELKVSEIESIAQAAQKLNIKNFIISGGEPLLHPEFARIVQILRRSEAKLSLATNGIILGECAPLVSEFFSTVFVSWDSNRPEIYARVRGIDALTQVTAGIKTLKRLKPSISVIARNVLQKSNYPDLAAIVKTAKDLGVDHISFSAADVASVAFGRKAKLPPQIAQDILLEEKDLAQFKRVIFNLKKESPDLFAEKFIIEGYSNLIRIHNYYAAMIGKNKFPAVLCNLPWLYAVIEADGGLKPCCLQGSVGNIRQRPLEEIVKDSALVRLRRNLKKQRVLLCERCAYASARVHLKMLFEVF